VPKQLSELTPSKVSLEKEEEDVPEIGLKKGDRFRMNGAEYEIEGMGDIIKSTRCDDEHRMVLYFAADKLDSVQRVERKNLEKHEERDEEESDGDTDTESKELKDAQDAKQQEQSTKSVDENVVDELETETRPQAPSIPDFDV